MKVDGRPGVEARLDRLNRIVTEVFFAIRMRPQSGKKRRDWFFPDRVVHVRIGVRDRGLDVDPFRP